jgi:hypothetical protein
LDLSFVEDPIGIAVKAINPSKRETLDSFLSEFYLVHKIDSIMNIKDFINNLAQLKDKMSHINKNTNKWVVKTFKEMKDNGNEQQFWNGFNKFLNMKMEKEYEIFNQEILNHILTLKNTWDNSKDINDQSEKFKEIYYYIGSILKKSYILEKIKDPRFNEEDVNLLSELLFGTKNNRPRQPLFDYTPPVTFEKKNRHNEMFSNKINRIIEKIKEMVNSKNMIDTISQIIFFYGKNLKKVKNRLCYIKTKKFLSISFHQSDIQELCHEKNFIEFEEKSGCRLEDLMKFVAYRYHLGY